MRLLALLLAALLLLFSAPRSAPERFVSGVFEGTPSSAQGRSGAPTEVASSQGAPTTFGAPLTEGWPSSKALVSKTSERVERTGVQILHLPPLGESSDEASPPPAKRLSVHSQGFESPALLHTHIGTAAGAIRGTARWFATGPNGVAAAGPRLRAALGSHWRGTLVGVTYRGRTVWVRLGDFCGCGSGSIIDLPDEVFRKLAPLSTGVFSVTVHWGDRNTLPATDTEP